MSDELGLTQENRYLSVSTPFGDDVLLLTGVRGQEAMFELFRYEFDMVSEDGDLDFTTIVGEDITASILLDDDAETVRTINGMVTEFSQGGFDANLWHYKAVVRPKFWLATRAAGCKIFQEMSVTDIIEDVLGTLGVSDYQLDTTGSYAARDYCVQYNETAFAFLCRLMEDEGIFFFHTHADETHTLVIADDADGHPDCEGVDAAVYKPQQEGVMEVEDAILDLAYTQRVVTDKFAADDFTFETPSTDLYVSADGAESGSDMEVYEYPGGYTEKDAGESRANIRLQEFEVATKELTGASSIKGFMAGCVFTLDWAERESLNDDYVLRRVSIDASHDAYRNMFSAYPKSMTYRPLRRTKRPRIPGTQTAIVVGKSGEEIWTDEYGRIKVQFHWDQEGENDENSSCWVRVAQGWAGKNWGNWFLPRIGMEVVVSFINGDPDAPLVTGCVYNAEQVLPYDLPDDQTKSTMKSNSSKGGDGFNEFRFEDLAGEEEIYMHAQKDWNTDVENDRNTTLVEGNDTLTVETGNRTMEVQTGDEENYVAGNRTLKIDGDQDHTTGGNVTHDITGDMTLKIGGNLTISVTGDILVESDATTTLNSVSDMALNTDAALATTSGAGTTIDATAALAATSGGDTTIDAGQNFGATAGMDATVDGGMNVALTAGMSFSADGGMDATVSGGTTVTCSGGASGTFDGGAMTTISGALINVG